jgi:hypothetical protein
MNPSKPEAGTRGEYLWDRGGPADPEVARLEELLSPYRHNAARTGRLRVRTRRWGFAAAAAAVVLAGFGAWRVLRPEPAGWDIVRFEGAPSVAGREVSKVGRLPVGQWLTTDAASSVFLERGGIGHVTIDPGSRVRVVRNKPEEQRLELARGRLDAFVVTPPRIFFVETPSGTAVDYGCRYTLDVDDAGAGILRVTLGLVRLESAHGEATVPRGAECRMTPGRGPGTPVFSDAPAGFREAAALLDSVLADPGTNTSKQAARQPLDTLLTATRPRDALTLWHLIPRLEGGAREAAYGALANLVPPPTGVTRDGVLALDRGMLDRWWETMQVHFW